MDGIIIIDKPSGITSFDVVRKIKKELQIKKVGHTGTLDPLATGVLPICIGSATKVSNYFLNGNKQYEVVLKLGMQTDTYDREGEIIYSSDLKVTDELIYSTIIGFQGTIDQIPPKFSALKINGERAYNLARKGIEFNLNSRQITIYKIDNIKIDFPYASFTVLCSKGTYIRSLCDDIGKKLKTGATMWNLKRIGSGNLTIENAVSFHELSAKNIEKFILDIDDVLKKEGYIPINISKKLETLLLNGVCIKDKSLINEIPNGDNLLVYNSNKKFLGIATKNINGLKAEKIFFR
ncbi:tRNA pseudouridine(55) synthase TruB [Clostridium sp. DL1XJH146]